MAKLTVTRRGDRIPVGNLIEQTVRTGTTGANAGDEWVGKEDLGMSEIVAVTGLVLVGTAAGLQSTVIPNARGTAQAENSSYGDLGVEAGGNVVLEITVRGKP